MHTGRPSQAMCHSLFCGSWCGHNVFILCSIIHRRGVVDRVEEHLLFYRAYKLFVLIMYTHSKSTATGGSCLHRQCKQRWSATTARRAAHPAGSRKLEAGLEVARLVVEAGAQRVGCSREHDLLEQQLLRRQGRALSLAWRQRVLYATSGLLGGDPAMLLWPKLIGR